MMPEFNRDWQKAVLSFNVMQLEWDPHTGKPVYIHAEADTGSKYEVVAMDVLSAWRNPDWPTTVITVLNPWQTAWTTPRGGMVWPDYALKHWRSPRRTVSEMHGGDAAALVICLNIIATGSVESSVEFAGSFFREESNV